LSGPIVAFADPEKGCVSSSEMIDRSSGPTEESAKIKDFIPTRHCVPIDIRWLCEKGILFHWK